MRRTTNKSRIIRPNPSLVAYLSNPGKTSGLMSYDVQFLGYRHIEDKQEYIHVFGDDEEPQIRKTRSGEVLLLDVLPDYTDVMMFFVGNDILLQHMGGKPLSKDF